MRKQQRLRVLRRRVCAHEIGAVLENLHSQEPGLATVHQDVGIRG